MSNARIALPLALALFVMLPGCGKKEPVAGTAEAPAAAAPTAVAHPAPAEMATEPVNLKDIARAEGGKTVAEVFAEKDSLAGTKVVIRGKVVKTNPMIMDRNWLHLRDGTGAEGTNDLTVTTTSDLPDLGDTVVVTGLVSVDKDLGLGYQYPVILEDAEVVVE